MKLSRAVQKYVDAKRCLGISFVAREKILISFSNRLRNKSVCDVTKWHVLSFLDRSRGSNITWMVNYRMLKAFFEYWLARGQLSEVPMPRCRMAGNSFAFLPYVYSTAELTKLLRHVSLRRPCRKRNQFDSLTFRTILLFLYGTGARINETLQVATNDVDLKRGTITFRPSFVGRTRTVPIGPSLLKALRKYLQASRRSDCTRRHFFLRTDGRAIQARSLTHSFQTLRRKVGLSKPSELFRKPRIQDLRRTFAVHSMRAWLKQGRDIRAMLPVLGAYLGHVSLSSTETYLSMVPERFSKQLSRLGTGEALIPPGQWSNTHSQRPLLRAAISDAASSVPQETDLVSRPSSCGLR